MEANHHKDTSRRLTELLEYFSTTNDVSANQMEEGVKRIYAELPELEIDMPPFAYELPTL